MQWLEIIAQAIAAFIATNIDDIIVLMVFFTQVNTTLRTAHIVLGQYLGFAVLLLASLPGFFGGRLVPREWVGLLGLVPIGLGLYAYFHPDDEVADNDIQTVTSKPSAQWGLHPSAYAVAAVTVANGGDNIGVYVPLFANLSWNGLGITILAFAVLIGMWCAIAHYLAQHPAIAPVLTRYKSIIIPIVLIGLGCFILLESGTLTSLSRRI